MSSLLVTHGHHFGVRYRLMDRTSLGRSSTCTIQLLDEKVSRKHTTIERVGDRWVLRDEGSSNGTGLNGQLLLEPQELHPGDELAIGGNLMLFDPDLEILRDLEGAGAVVLAARVADGDPPAPGPAAAPLPLGLDRLLGGVAEMLSGPRGVGRPAALLEAVARGLGAERGALLLAPTGDEPLRAVATWPHRGRVTIDRALVARVMDERRPARTADGTLGLWVRAGRTLIESRAGAALAIPVLHGGRIRGLFYADAAAPDSFEPIPLDRVQAVVTIAFTHLLAGPPSARRPPRERAPWPPPVARSPAMQAVMQQAEAWAETAAPLLLRGETGVGLAYLAGYIHSISPRSTGPFAVARCAALPATTAERELFGQEPEGQEGDGEPYIGLLEATDGGTLLLDGVSDLPAPVQVKLLRTLQEGRFYRLGGTRPVRVDLRILAGTRRDLEALVGQGRLRGELVELLGGLRLELPPLRERLADIEPLLRAFVARFNDRNGVRMKGLTPEAVGLMESHPWPGNVRELRATVRRLLVGARGTWVEGPQVEEELATHPTESSGYAPSPELADRLEARQRRWLRGALERTGGDRARAARMLELPPAELDALLALLQLDGFGR